MGYVKNMTDKKALLFCLLRNDNPADQRGHQCAKPDVSFTQTNCLYKDKQCNHVIMSYVLVATALSEFTKGFKS